MVTFFVYVIARLYIWTEFFSCSFLVLQLLCSQFKKVQFKVDGRLFLIYTIFIENEYQLKGGC